jgi:hypothetical protein
MSTFNEREKAQESKYAHDAELEFKAQARRAKLVGLWAAGLMGMTVEAAEAYAKEVIISDLEAPGDDDLFAKVRADLNARGIAQTDHQIRRQMDELLETARAQLRAGA